MIDRDLIADAIASQFDSASRRVNIDLKEASRLTGHSTSSIIDAQNDVVSLLLRKKELDQVSNVAADVYAHRDAVMSIEKPTN